MNARKRDLIGRRIVAVNFRRFAPRPDQDKRKTASDPVLTLDNGRKIWFVTEETDVGDYGTVICIDEK